MSPGYPWSENKKKLDFFLKLTQKTNKNQNNNIQNVINGGVKDSDLLGRVSA